MKGSEFEVRIWSPVDTDIPQRKSAVIYVIVIAAQSIQKAMLIVGAIIRLNGDKVLPFPLTPGAEIIGVNLIGSIKDSARIVDLSALGDDVRKYDRWCSIVEELGFQPYEVKFIIREEKVIGFVPKDDLRHPDGSDSAHT